MITLQLLFTALVVVYIPGAGALFMPRLSRSFAAIFAALAGRLALERA